MSDLLTDVNATEIFEFAYYNFFFCSTFLFLLSWNWRGGKVERHNNKHCSRKERKLAFFLNGKFMYHHSNIIGERRGTAGGTFIKAILLSKIRQISYVKRL